MLNAQSTAKVICVQTTDRTCILVCNKNVWRKTFKNREGEKPCLVNLFISCCWLLTFTAGVNIPKQHNFKCSSCDLKMWSRSWKDICVYTSKTNNTIDYCANLNISHVNIIYQVNNIWETHKVRCVNNKLPWTKVKVNNMLDR